MRRRKVVSSAKSFAAISAVAPRLHAQVLVEHQSAPLLLTRIIPIPDTVGRFDHMSFDNERP